MPWVGTNDTQHTLAPNDFTVLTNPSDGCPDLHDCLQPLIDLFAPSCARPYDTTCPYDNMPVRHIPPRPTEHSASYRNPRSSAQPKLKAFQQCGLDSSRSAPLPYGLYPLAGCAGNANESPPKRARATVARRATGPRTQRPEAPASPFLPRVSPHPTSPKCQLNSQQLNALRSPGPGFPGPALSRTRNDFPDAALRTRPHQRRNPGRTGLLPNENPGVYT